MEDPNVIISLIVLGAAVTVATLIGFFMMVGNIISMRKTMERMESENNERKSQG